MKKLLIPVCLLLCLPLLCSCAVNWGGKQYDVHWWVIVLPVAVLMVLSHLLIVCRKYRCPKCGKVFKPRFYQISFWLHNGSSRAGKCPHCGKIGFFRPAGKE